MSISIYRSTILFSMEYKFTGHIDIVDDLISTDALIEHFSVYKSSFLVRERGFATGKPHFHFIFFDERKEKSHRNLLLARFPQLKGGKGKKGQIYSLTDDHTYDEDPIAGYRYLCKGASHGELPEWCHGTLPIGETVSSLHEAYWAANKVLAKQRREASKTKHPMEEAEAFFKNYSWPKDFPSCVQAMFTFFVDHAVHRNKGTNEYIISQYVTTLIHKYFPDKKLLYVSNQTDKLLEKYGIQA